MDELLVKYLLGETTTTEAEQVRRWLDAHEDNRKHFDHFKLIWAESKKLEHTSTVDEDKAWERFRAQLPAQQSDSVTQAVAFAPKRRSFPMRAAAGIALILLGGLSVFYFSTRSGGDIVLATGDAVRTDTLPDGSIITLNKHATLAYAKNFNTKTRNVTLTGEAFFNVSPNKQKPFNIAVNDVKVHVVGTSFNIKSDNRQTEVIVETGIVDVGVAEQQVKVLPKQKVLVKKYSAKLKVEQNPDELYNYYRTKTFYCSNTPLYQVADALSNAYNVKIVVAGSKRNLPLEGVYKDMQLDPILTLISKTLNVKIEKTRDTVFIK